MGSVLKSDQWFREELMDTQKKEQSKKYFFWRALYYVAHTIRIFYEPGTTFKILSPMEKKVVSYMLEWFGEYFTIADMHF